jgi:hypothetical protein
MMLDATEQATGQTGFGALSLWYGPFSANWIVHDHAAVTP